MPVLFHYFFTNFLSDLWGKTVSNLCLILTSPLPTGLFVTNYRNALSFLPSLHILKPGIRESNDVTDIIAVFCID